MVKQYDIQIKKLMSDLVNTANTLLSFCEEIGEEGEELWLENGNIRIVLFRDVDNGTEDNIQMRKWISNA